MPKAAILCGALLLATALLAHFSPAVKQRITWRAYLMEDAGGTIHFDPVRGYRLSGNRARQTQYTWGMHEYAGAWHGNNMGFQDALDFHPARRDPDTYRLAVLGDSMSAAPFLSKNWADRVEEKALADGLKLEILSFSQDGTGLSNWWSLLINEIAAKDYDIDGVMYAVSGDGLRRAFSIMSEHEGQLWFGEVPFPETRAWDTDTWPQTLEEAKPYLRPIGVVCSPQDFEKALEGNYGSLLPSPFASVPSTLKSLLLPIYDRYFGDTEAYQEGQAKMIEEMAQWVKSKDIQTFVTQIPLQGWIVRGGYGEIDVELKKFADKFDAVTINGNRAFENLSEAEIRKNFWLPYDGHWAQAGSDHFAEFMYKELVGTLPLKSVNDATDGGDDLEQTSP